MDSNPYPILFPHNCNIHTPGLAYLFPDFLALEFEPCAPGLGGLMIFKLIYDSMKEPYFSWPPREAWVQVVDPMVPPKNVVRISHDQCLKLLTCTGISALLFQTSHCNSLIL